MSSTVFTGKSALITGASAGLGEEFARQLVQWGATHLILTARRADRLLKLKADLLAKLPGLRVDTFTADLAASADVARLIDALDQQNIAPDILINNAGFGDLGTFETSDPAKIEAMLAVNIAALTRLTRWALPAMLVKRSGWICNVGSTAGLLPLPSFAVYGATKAYVNSFSEALRVELHGSGIFVTALLPGPVETEFGQVASRANSRRQFAPPAFLCVDKGDVVRETLDAMAHGKGRIIPGLPVRLPMLLVESVPRWLLRFIFNLTSGNFRRERQDSIKT
ncbi:MAG: SDR family oxidoreductase [Methylacidiphilales bacterium]|nr:SDR family oxidoreductase [Candidatus Methylacidiphilales bacterium]